MTCSDFSPNAFASRAAAPAREVGEAAYEAELLREQYRSLARQAPYLYCVLIVATITLCCAAELTAAPLHAIFLASPTLAVALIRLNHWLRARAGVERQSLEVMQREVRRAGYIGPAAAFGLSLIAAALTLQGGVFALSLALVAIWITAAASVFCLIVLGRVASLVIFALTTPFIIALLIRADDLSTAMAALLVLDSCLAVPILGENFRMYSEIVRSRVAIAEKHRAAENARDAAAAIALTDDLTVLPNRRGFQTLLANSIRAGRDSARPFALGLLDLNGFKSINDIHGHPIGDEILKQVAERLAKTMTGRGHAARIAGDEFAILCEGLESHGEVLAFSRNIRDLFATPFRVEALSIHVSGACGFALFPVSADEADELIRLADVALYRAKSARRGGVSISDPSAEAAGLERVRLEQALRQAVAESKISVYFQPIFELATGRVRGFESLARWSDPTLGPVAPSVFIPVAEQIGLIDQLSCDLLRKAVRAAASWPSDLSLSFNLSAAQLSTPGAGLHIVATLNEFGLPPTRFEAEVTETAIMENVDAARATIEALRSAGVRVALDDFGAGGSSLSQVRDLALDKIKIDKSFIDKVCDDPKIAGLTLGIVDMCRRLDLPCVAEGIERQEQLDELRLGGCASGQGALLASAMPEAMVAAFIEERRRMAA